MFGFAGDAGDAKGQHVESVLSCLTFPAPVRFLRVDVAVIQTRVIFKKDTGLLFA